MQISKSTIYDGEYGVTSKEKAFKEITFLRARVQQDFLNIADSIFNYLSSENKNHAANEVLTRDHLKNILLKNFQCIQGALQEMQADINLSEDKRLKTEVKIIINSTRADYHLVRQFTYFESYFKQPHKNLTPEEMTATIRILNQETDSLMAILRIVLKDHVHKLENIYRNLYSEGTINKLASSTSGEIIGALAAEKHGASFAETLTDKQLNELQREEIEKAAQQRFSTYSTSTLLMARHSTLKFEKKIPKINLPPVSEENKKALDGLYVLYDNIFSNVYTKYKANELNIAKFKRLFVESMKTLNEMSAEYANNPPSVDFFSKRAEIFQQSQDFLKILTETHAVQIKLKEELNAKGIEAVKLIDKLPPEIRCNLAQYIAVVKEDLLIRSNMVKAIQLLMITSNDFKEKIKETIYSPRIKLK